MVSVCLKSFLFGCLVATLTQFESVQCNIWSSLATGVTGWANRMVDIVGHPYSAAFGFIQSKTTTTLCKKNTDELCEHYGYKSEVHKVITKDGYILTVFRCYANKTSSRKRRAVILQHGLLCSSDDFTVNIPEQALAYVMANADYDVWMPNFRGNFYSKEHVSLETSDPRFWNFSFYEMAIYDYPACIDYVRYETGNDQVYIVPHSQGTLALIAMLAEVPEYNKYVAAASLLAPISFLSHSAPIYRALSTVGSLLQFVKYSELLPRAGISDLTESFCSIDVTNFCNSMLTEFLGQSDYQRNESMMTSFLCKVPSGASAKQIIHFSQMINFKYCGRYMYGTTVPNDFDFSRITVPLSIHYSPTDTFTHPKDVNRLISKLNHTLAMVQVIDSPHFCHADFIWGIQAAPIIYEKIITEHLAKH